MFKQTYLEFNYLDTIPIIKPQNNFKNQVIHSQSSMKLPVISIDLTTQPIQAQNYTYNMCSSKIIRKLIQCIRFQSSRFSSNLNIKSLANDVQSNMVGVQLNGGDSNDHTSKRLQACNIQFSMFNQNHSQFNWMDTIPMVRHLDKM
jgi:hypothetical protein